MSESCVNCRFYREGRSYETIGKCVRYPQHVDLERNTWCGEWQPQPEKTDDS